MEWDNPVKIENFKQASYAKQTKMASKLQNYMEFNAAKQEDIDKLKVTIGLPLYGVPAGQQHKSEQEQEGILNNIFDHFSAQQQANVNSIICACLSHSNNPADKILLSKVLINTTSPNGQADVYVLRIHLENEDEKLMIGFADGDGRFYKSWKDFLLNNTLHKCFMVYPKDGKYVCSENGEWLINGTFSSACSLRNVVLEKTDMACLALAGLGIGAYVLRIDVPRVVAVGGGLASIVVSTYSVLRNFGSLVDKKVHHQKLKWSQKENRQLWINTAVGVVGLASLGISSTVGKEVQCAVALGRLQSISSSKLILYNSVVYSTHLIFGTSLTNLIYTLFQEKRFPTLTEAAHFSISFLHYYNTIVNTKTAGQLVSQLQRQKHCKYPYMVGPIRGKKIAMEVQDQVLSLLYDKVVEHDQRLKQLENGLGQVKTVKPIKSSMKDVKRGYSLVEEFEYLEKCLKEVFGLDSTTPSATENVSAPVEGRETFRDSFLTPHANHEYVKADYDPNFDILSDFFEYEFGSEKKT